ncbi:MAG: CDP-alcohol phosphatidyltransferase family protein [Bacteroidales bacterium]|nr:CDP-alcohol phosphatidyltransferase family protein [Bacteroidales bacterium]
MDKKAARIQTSILNGPEKKVLVWLAKRQPKWVNSDMLTWIGMIGAILIAAGYSLSTLDYRWIWLSSLGLFVNWYGDSLDGTLARVRNTPRPIYGYYIDHTVDGFNETLMFLGLGLSPYLNLYLALAMLVAYLQLTLNVSMNAHLRSEFRLTYAGLGPTEFRVAAVILNTLLIFVKPWREFEQVITVLGKTVYLHTFDYPGLVILAFLSLTLIRTVIRDAAYYAKIDPMPRHSEKSDSQE